MVERRLLPQKEGLASLTCRPRVPAAAKWRDVGKQAELQSLSIPGTYQEKITHLGTSLVNLTGLKSLDLSRNSLVSLEGVQYLTALESLSLYYNSISSLAEVLRLHCLPALAHVDLRLNPVVKTEADYRLFVVHALPKLRQLDDRPVRESERQASRLHFASEEESLSSERSFPAGFIVRRPCHSRALCADPSAKKCLVMDADDEAVLNLIAECEWDLSNPPGSTSSSQREREADLHSSQESRHLLSPRSAQPQCGDSVKKGHEKRKGSSRGCGPEKRLQNQLPLPCGQHVPFTARPDSADTEDSTPSEKSSLSAEKVFNPWPAPEQYRRRRAPGRRSQAPADQAGLRRLERPTVSWNPEETLSRQSDLEGRSERTLSRSEVSEPEDGGPCGRSGPGEVAGGRLSEHMKDPGSRHPCLRTSVQTWLPMEVGFPNRTPLCRPGRSPCWRRPCWRRSSTWWTGSGAAASPCVAVRCSGGSAFSVPVGAGACQQVLPVRRPWAPPGAGLWWPFSFSCSQDSLRSRSPQLLIP
ncbi:centrosomal protein of 72 kDa isoform X12 [Meles meles]|uniref:centrosomal protein of 72 kDa isoform X12 n=1 Tax=Meles meles TaxID=9662 RepID=UPI001E69E768|nr:centrosomal protein of 72 kDa isoform X12 [Meles meles]